MAGASRGMAGMVMPTQQSLSQEIYQRYYPAIYAVDYMQQAIAAAEANPYVDTANALAVEVQGMQKRYDARRAELVAQQKAILAQRAKLNAARIKGASGGGYKMLKLALEGIKAMEDIDVQMDTLRSGRLEMGGVEDRMAQVDTYGDINSLSSGGKAAIEAIAGVVEGDTATSATAQRIQAIAATEEGAALQAIRASDDLLARGSAARALAIRLERNQKMGAGEAAQFAADYFDLGDMTQLATASGQAKVKQQLRSTVDEAVVSSGIGEDDLPRQRALAGEVVRLALTGIGAGKGAAAAVSAQEKAKQLTPQESADLRLYLAALANDGIANLEEGETVLTGGREVALTPKQIAAGKQAYDKAKKHGTFRAEDAAWFDDELLKMYKDKVERGAEADAKRAMAIGRAERTPEEVRREAAEQFVRTATAARDLEDYVPLDTPGVNSAFEATVMGGASHIARREGTGVFDLKAAHEDRARRLGGTGPLAQTPLRKAQDAFRLAGGSETTPMSDEQFGKAAKALRQRFKRNPDRAEQALQYLFAMQLVSTQQRDGQSADPSTVDTDLPPPPPPGATPPPPGLEDIPRGGTRPDPDRDVIPEALPPTGAGASRAAQPAPAGGQSFNMMEGVQQPFRMTGVEDADTQAAQADLSSLPAHVLHPALAAGAGSGTEFGSVTTRPAATEADYEQLLRLADPDATGGAALARHERRVAGEEARAQLARFLPPPLDPGQIPFTNIRYVDGRLILPSNMGGGTANMQAAASRRRDIAAQQMAAEQQALIDAAALPPMIGGSPGNRQVGEVLTEDEILRELYLSGAPTMGRP
jgi:hypothetical protein